MQPPFPEYILPLPHYAAKINQDKLDSSSWVVCRVIDKPVDDYLVTLHGGVQILKGICLGGSVLRLSLHLLGGALREEDICFRGKNAGTKEWKGEDARSFLNPDNYAYEKASYPLHYMGAHLHNLTVPASISGLKDNKGKRKAMQTQLSGKDWSKFDNLKDVAIVNAKITIEHVPTFMNYWHMQMEVTPEGTNEKLKNEKSWRGDILSHIKAEVLTKRFTTSLAVIPRVSPCSYCRLIRNCKVSSHH